MYERRKLAERLRRAALLGRWSEVRAVADQLHEADRRRQQQWQWPWMARQSLWPPASGGKERTVMHPDAARELIEPVARPPMDAPQRGGERFVLWVDAVGGFLVCMGDEVSLGQAAADGVVDVPILGDLARRHAIIRRDGEGYWIDPLRGVRVDGRPIERPVTLADGRLLELGEGVKLRFHQPHPLSTTARLELTSFHRTQPTTDGVLLMADACILGPHPQSHIFAPEIEGEVVLFRQGNGLACRGPGELEIDGVAHRGGGPLTGHSRVVGESFSFTLEALVK